MPAAVNTDTSPDDAARHDPLHAIIADGLRHLAAGHEAGRIWGRRVDASHEDGAEANVWAGTPEDVADNLVRIIRDQQVT